MQLRAKTLAELRSTLDDSYFTADSFEVVNHPNGAPFLEISFAPSPNFFFNIYEASDGAIVVDESPGQLVASKEERHYKNLATALMAVRPWIRRIREEYEHAAALRSEVDDFLDQFRAKVFSTNEDEDPTAAFTDTEITALKQSLDQLKAVVTAQAEQIKATSREVEQFEAEIEKIKQDLQGMPRGVWKKVASNKLLKSVENFMGTPEGRALIADGLKKLIGME